MPSTSGASAADAAPPTTLALDTTAGRCSVALLSPRGLVRRAEPMVHGHSRHVLAMVDAVLGEAGVAPSAIDAIGFGSGPGSFTGLRIACGVAQGLGFGWARPVVPVDAMRTLARQAADAAGAEGGVRAHRVLVALDLRMGQVCFAMFRLDGRGAAPGWPEPMSAPVLGSPEAAIAAFEALEALEARGGVDDADAPVAAVRAAPAATGRPSVSGGTRLAGDGFDAYAALAAWAVDGSRIRSPDAVQPDASAVARLAAVGWRGGRAVDAASAAPTYLRDKVALDVGEQAALRAARAAMAGVR
jgi:tRNA threonylcarbamoyladenosine biosynthesis protein TsaB